MTTHKKAKSKKNINRFTLPVDGNLATHVWMRHHLERIDKVRSCLVLETIALDSRGSATDAPVAIRDVQITIRLHGRFLAPDSIEIEATPFYHCGLHYKMTRHMKTCRRATLKCANPLETYLRGITHFLRKLDPTLTVTHGGYANILYGSDSFFTATEITFPLSVIAIPARRCARESYAYDGRDHQGYGRSDLVDGYWFRWDIASGSKILKRLSSLLLCNNGSEEQLT